MGAFAICALLMVPVSHAAPDESQPEAAGSDRSQAASSGQSQAAGSDQSQAAAASDQTRAAATDEEARTAAAPVPFLLGESLSYKVSVGIFGASGHGSLTVAGLDTIRQRPAYHLRMLIKGGILFGKVDDRLESWLDAFKLCALRFEQDQHEIRYRRHRILDFFHEECRWQRVDSQEGGSMPTDAPLDEISFIYFVRTIPLEVGQTYTFDRYFKREGNPVILQVLRKQRITLPAGVFDTVVVRPIIHSGGLFGQGGEAEIYFTDDGRRLPVELRSKVPVLGHLDLALERYSPGTATASGVTEAGKE